MHVKVYMTGTFFVLIRKAIQNTDFDIPFFVFSIMQIRSVIVILYYILQLKSGKNYINDISWNKSSVLVTWHHKCLSQKKQKITPLMLLPWQHFCHWCRLNKTWNSQVFLKPRIIYPTQSIDGSYDNMETMSVPSATLLSHFRGCK